MSLTDCSYKSILIGHGPFPSVCRSSVHFVVVFSSVGVSFLFVSSIFWLGFVQQSILQWGKKIIFFLSFSRVFFWDFRGKVDGICIRAVGSLGTDEGGIRVNFSTPVSGFYSCMLRSLQRLCGLAWLLVPFWFVGIC